MTTLSTSSCNADSATECIMFDNSSDKTSSLAVSPSSSLVRGFANPSHYEPVPLRLTKAINAGTPCPKRPSAPLINELLTLHCNSIPTFPKSIIKLTSQPTTDPHLHLHLHLHTNSRIFSYHTPTNSLTPIVVSSFPITHKSRHKPPHHQSRKTPQSLLKTN